jgi:hypothetical protein
MEEKWGVGENPKEKQAFGKTIVDGHEYDLIFGDYPHSRQDNTIYARDKEGRVTGFDGHRLPFKIVIEERNYMKDSELSGDQIRKSCKGELWLNGIQIYDGSHRTYERMYKEITRFIDEMEMNWSWFPNKLEEVIGKTIGYKEQLFVIERVIVDQACLILKHVEGKRKKFLYEDEEDFDEYEAEDSVKVEITSPQICWYPHTS